jgi:hypothetical protein
MASINYALKEISCKVVYYGPGMCGKTTNLQYIHQHTVADKRGNMVSLATPGERTLFFDFLPLEASQVHGFRTKFQVYTVPGQVMYNSTRKLVLRAVDGVIFVCDSQWEKMRENVESFRNLQENLASYGYRGRRVRRPQLHLHAGPCADVSETECRRDLAGPNGSKEDGTDGYVRRRELR